MDMVWTQRMALSIYCRWFCTVYNRRSYLSIIGKKKSTVCVCVYFDTAKDFGVLFFQLE